MSDAAHGVSAHGKAYGQQGLGGYVGEHDRHVGGVAVAVAEGLEGEDTVRAEEEIIIFTIGLIIPLILAIRYSLTNWDGMSAEKTFVGFQNYIDLMKDSDFWNAWWFTIKFTIGNTIIQNVVALLFAVALDSGIKAQKIYRTVFFIPCLISAVIVGFVWLKMFSNVLPAFNDLLGT